MSGHSGFPGLPGHSGMPKLPGMPGMPHPGRRGGPDSFRGFMPPGLAEHAGSGDFNHGVMMHLGRGGALDALGQQISQALDTVPMSDGTTLTPLTTSMLRDGGYEMAPQPPGTLQPRISDPQMDPVTGPSASQLTSQARDVLETVVRDTADLFTPGEMHGSTRGFLNAAGPETALPETVVRDAANIVRPEEMPGPARGFLNSAGPESAPPETVARVGANFFRPEGMPGPARGVLNAAGPEPALPETAPGLRVPAGEQGWLASTNPAARARAGEGVMPGAPEAVPDGTAVVPEDPESGVWGVSRTTRMAIADPREATRPVAFFDGENRQPGNTDRAVAWPNGFEQNSAMKLSLMVIPPLLREGEPAQPATRLALFSAMVNGQQAFVDSQGRVVGWAVRQDLPQVYVTNVVQNQQLMQLPDGRQAIVDSQGRVLGIADSETLRRLRRSEATDPRVLQQDGDEKMLMERAEKRFHEILWTTVFPSCIGLLLVIAAFLSAAAVGAMPWLLHALFLIGAIGFAVFCVRTFKHSHRLPDGSVTRLPAVTRRLRIMMALSYSAQGAGAVLLCAASVFF